MSCCPACSFSDLTPFYSARGVSTTSNLLMSSREEAIRWPRGDVTLAYCGRCGFITNTAFVDEAHAAAARYEATQACSATFGKFARELAADWIERYQLRGKRIVEIGCGQGEFIAMLCDLAGATGWGIDPLVEPARAAPSTRVTWLAEKFGPQHANLSADFIVCRHTLEHIADVGAFLLSIRTVIANRRDVVLAIEVPDTLRVLAEGAFWDIYYEHCSYFDADSLAAALSTAGFELIRSRLVYAGQYLIVEAIATEQIPPERAGPERAATVRERLRENGEDRSLTVAARLTSFAAHIAEFTRTCGAKQSYWRNVLAAGDCAVWGSGSKAVGFLSTLGVGDEVSAVVDINPAKHGTFLPGTGHEIVSPDRLKQLRPKRVIVMNPIYRGEIQKSLDDMGVSAEVLCLE